LPEVSAALRHSGYFFAKPLAWLALPQAGLLCIFASSHETKLGALICSHLQHPVSWAVCGLGIKQEAWRDIHSVFVCTDGTRTPRTVHRRQHEAKVCGDSRSVSLCSLRPPPVQFGIIWQRLVVFLVQFSSLFPALRLGLSKSFHYSARISY
jgi:hypothetical protein